jgi:hypothetical protein
VAALPSPARAPRARSAGWFIGVFTADLGLWACPAHVPAFSLPFPGDDLASVAGRRPSAARSCHGTATPRIHASQQPFNPVADPSFINERVADLPQTAAVKALKRQSHAMPKGGGHAGADTRADRLAGDHRAADPASTEAGGRKGTERDGGR